VLQNVGMTASLTEDRLKMLREAISLRVAAGYEDRQSLVEGGIETLEDEFDDEDDVERTAVESILRRIIDEEVNRHLAEEAQWPATTDYDRLAAAFDELTRSGILVLENFTCCSTCARAEIPDELAAYGPTARGFMYFHEQDTESAIYHGQLLLGFGSVTDEPDSGVAIAKEIVAVLVRQGLDIEWDGRFHNRILVRLDWKRRRTVD
jgi:hypothetical protein